MMRPSQVLDAIAHLPEDAEVGLSVQVGDLRTALESVEANGPRSWVPIKEAAAITGEEQSMLRSAALRWRGRPQPPIRVRKNDPGNPQSHWQFCEEDCWAYAREKGRVGTKDALKEITQTLKDG